jgi:HK97 family phage prohead protease
MSTKTLDDASLKAALAPVTDQRTIDYYMLAFSDMPDKQGDVIAKDAADDWLERFYAAGVPHPVSFTHAAIHDAQDPFNIIGYAPADVQHVFKDEHGIRVIANLDIDMNPTAAQVYSLVKRGIITGASVAYFTTTDGQKYQKDGSVLITKIDDILESGPCLDPANEDAYVMAVKAMEAMTTKAVDDTAWDGNRAMGQCSTAAQYRSICAGERSTGEPDERQHWALPHHYLGQGPNAGGVRAALSRLPQTEGLSNAGAARSHLEGHMSSVSPDREAANPQEDLKLVITLVTDVATKAGRKLSAANRQKLRAAQEVISELLSLDEDSQPDAETKANAEEPVTANAEEPGPNDWLREQLDALQLA